MTTFVFLLCARGASAQTARVALVVGNDAGRPDEPRLRYAEIDAERMAGLLTGLGGFAPGNTILVKGQSADEIRGILTALSVRLGQTPGEHLFFFYYSGHADGQSLHVGKDSLPFAELKSLILALPVATRVVIVDACQAGAMTRLKGGQPGPSFDIENGAEPPRGIAILASSRDTEFAQESDEIQGSFFTHHLYAGLLGMADRDHDGRVSLGEAFDYASAHTLDATIGTWAGPQHPTFRYDLAGQEDVTLTQPGLNGGTYGHVIFDRPGWYFIRPQQGSTLAEVSSGGHDEIALEQGSYELTKRDTDHLELADLDVAPGGTVPVSELSLRKQAFGRVVRKGAGLRPNAYAMSLVGMARSSVAELGPAAGASFSARIDWPSISAELRINGGTVVGSTAVPSRTTEASVSIAALRAWDIGILTLAGGLEGGSAAFRQRVGSGLPHWTYAPLFGPTVLLEVPFATRLCLRAEFSLPMYALDLQTENGTGLKLLASVRGGLGAGGYF